MRFVIVIILFINISCSRNEKEEPIEVNKFGRFQLVQLGTFRRDQYLLDTETGNMWSRICAAPAGEVDCKYSYWDKEDIVNINATSEQVDAIGKLYQGKRK